MTIVITIGLAIIELKSMLEHAKKRKSKTAELPNLAERIVECATKKDATELIALIKNEDDEKKD